MDAKQIIENNFTAQNESFVYFLQEKALFEKKSFKQLYEAIRSCAEQEVAVGPTTQKINTIYGKILKCLLYHFDPQDKFQINDLPENYNKMINLLDRSVSYYFSTRI